MKNYIYIVTQLERGRENTLGSQLDPIGTRFLISKFRATDSSKAKAFFLVLFVFLVVCACACIVLIEQEGAVLFLHFSQSMTLSAL